MISCSRLYFHRSYFTRGFLEPNLSVLGNDLTVLVFKCAFHVAGLYILVELLINIL